MNKTKKLPFWLIITIAIIIAFGGGAVGIFYTLHQTQIPPKQTAQIGGRFRLISPADSIVSDSIFRGKWMFMYFGASRCIDNICSKTLDKMGNVINLLGNKASKVSPIFISYDLEYDTPSRLMFYMKPFNNKIIALTGGELAIRDVSILYHAPIKKTQVTEQTMLIQPYDQFIIMDPSGNYSTSIPVNESAKEISHTLNKLIP